MYRIATCVCAVAAVALVAWGIILAFRYQPEVSESTEPPIIIDRVQRDLGEVSPGELDVVFEVTNPASRPRRIIGFAEG